MEEGWGSRSMLNQGQNTGHSGVASNEPISLHSSYFIILMCALNICLVLCFGFPISIEIIENF